MYFKKINENKIRIILNLEDLLKKHLDYHTFMTNPIESQDLFLDCLKEAEKQIGFSTKNYKLNIEALAISKENFILTITRFIPPLINKKSYKKKSNEINNTILINAIYKFTSFDNYCDFISFFKTNYTKSLGIAEKILLYEYKNSYFLVLKKINIKYLSFKNFFSIITEFASFLEYSDTYINKLNEKGNLIIKHNALKIAVKYF